MAGGGQERSVRPGTENILGILGLAAVCKTPLCWDGVQELRDYLEFKITEDFEDAIIIGRDNTSNSKPPNDKAAVTNPLTPRLGNTTMVAMPGIKSSTQVMCLDLHGIAVSSGSACSSGKVRTSRSLMAMGFEERISGSAIRISLGPSNTKEEVEQLIMALKDVWKSPLMRH